MITIGIEEHIVGGGFDDTHIQERLRDMDEGGMNMQVLSYVFTPDENVNASDATSMAKSINNELSKIVGKYPERFASFAAIALQDPVAAAEELERAVTKLGFKGAMVFLPVKDGLDNRKYWVIFERAEKLDVPIYVHPGTPSPDMIKPFLTYPILSRAVWGFSVEGSLQAMRMIMSGLFDEYPRLKIILGHLGEGIPYWLWRIDNRWMGEKDGIPGLFEADPIASKLQRKPSRYFKENFYIATSGMFWPPVLQFVCSVLGAERVLLAVDDYHSESIKEAIQSVELTSISDSDKEKICHLNAERLLKL